MSLSSGVFLIQYYKTVVEYGVAIRKRISEKLNKKNERHYSVSCKAFRSAGRLQAQD